MSVNEWVGVDVDVGVIVVNRDRYFPLLDLIKVEGEGAWYLKKE
jgi:hypothetical protein